jgi:hypothetical protein
MTKKRLKRKRQLATRKTALQGGSLRGLTDLLIQCHERGWRVEILLHATRQPAVGQPADSPEPVCRSGGHGGGKMAQRDGLTPFLASTMQQLIAQTRELFPVTGEAATATGETTGGAESAARARTTISEQSSITVAIPGFGHEHGRALFCSRLFSQARASRSGIFAPTPALDAPDDDEFRSSVEHACAN